MENKLLHTPEGVRDLSPAEYKEKITTRDRLLEVMHKYGFLQMQTPSFEYFDVFSNNTGMTPSRELYKFFDKEGNTLVLRPDFTPSIARAYAKLYYDEKDPVRISYCGNTFVNAHDLQGRLKENTQIGAELYNDDSKDADAQMVILMASCMKEAGFNDFVISLGNVEFFKGLCEEYGISQENELALRELISEKNYYAAKELLDSIEISEDIKNLIVRISEMYSSIDSVKGLYEKMTNVRCKNALNRLIEVYDIVKDAGLSEYVSFDLGMLNKYNYYTGVLFRAYTYGFGDAIMKGGRYDNLVKEFGKDVPAIGFGISLDELLTAKQETKRKKNFNTSDDKYLTFALTKGRLANKTLELLEKIGITCEEMKDKDTRKLIFVNEELKLKFFLAKGPDVPTYVEHGVADIGVVGKDTIMEENRKVFEVLDLGFGKCRMCVCGPESAKEILKTRNMIKIATKYPRIAKAYFNDEKNQTVDIIKLNGSIELAPIVGLSEVIVDIVETGSTLRENGLSVLEEVCPLSARMIVNPVSMRMQSNRINELIAKVKEAL